MIFNETISSLGSFYDKLADDESREMFDVRFSYFVDRDVQKLEKNIVELALKRHKNEVSIPYVLRNYYDRHPEKKSSQIVVFGAGIAGERTIRTLKACGAEIAAVVDNNSDLYVKNYRVGEFVVESPDSIIKKYPDSVVILCIQHQHQIDAIYQLIEMGIDERNIIAHKEGCLFTGIGSQYFDIEYLKPQEGEVFLDCGCYDGATSRMAEKWAKGELKKVIAFEADSTNVEKCRNTLSALKCEYEIHNVATWSEKSLLHFQGGGQFSYASRINPRGSISVEADSIDNILNGKPATFIKLDVEGAELKTLEGARNTILNYKPKMAISIYHKPEDIVEIPLFLENLQLNYRYCIRHYQTRYCETVLYVF